MTESFLYRISGSGSYALDAYIPYYYPESANLLDYMPESTIVVLEEPARIREKARIFSQESSQNLQTRLEKGYILARQCGIYPEFEEIAAGLQRHPGLYVCGLIAANQQIFPIQELLSVSSHSINVLPSEREGFLKDLKRFTDEGYSCILLAESEYRVPGMIDFLTDEEIPVERQRDADQEPRPGVVTIMEGTLKQGFTCPAAKLLIAPQQENTAAKARRKRRFRVKNAQKVGAFSDLTPGDYVVHETHGVGIYQGIVQLEQNGASHDFFKIQYRDSGVLYVPTTSLELLQRYVGGEDAKPKVNRLGGQEWNRTKNKVQESVSKLAEKLVRLYAARQGTVGYAFSPDTVWQREFEDSFPFEETDDQLAAIEDTKKDMESDRIMDRLICGDVGYGKTEIAIRAAFKAVQGNKQVAVLAPTTILAQQHFNTFSSRMHEYPVKIGILSRFSTPKQRKEALVGIADGSMDILIGTHRILSKDVRFKNLGLLVVDEEVFQNVRLEYGFPAALYADVGHPHLTVPQDFENIQQMFLIGLLTKGGYRCLQHAAVGKILRREPVGGIEIGKTDHPIILLLDVECDFVVFVVAKGLLGLIQEGPDDITFSDALHPDRATIITTRAPAAIALTMSPEKRIPPSAMTETFASAATSAARWIAVI